MYKIMIVDDMEIVRRELKRLKIWGEASGFVISQEASNGQEALNLIAESPVDLIITDIKMPKIDGIELLRAIVDGKLCSCVVLLSDYSEFSYARQGIILGAFDYISKPLNENELICLLQRAREYLDNENREKERVRKLEESNSINSEVPYSLLEVGKLAELIKTGDQNTISFAKHMLEQISDKEKADLHTLENIFENSIQELIKELNQTNQWLEKFINITNLQTFRLPSNQDFESIGKIFVDKVNVLIQSLSVLRYNTQEKGIVGQVCNYVLDHVEDDISLSMIADHLFMNKTYISETFKQKTGIPFTEYVTRVKMERAKILIQQENLKAYEIAERIGFKDTEYFSKVFKKSTGLTTTEYRKLHS